MHKKYNICITLIFCGFIGIMMLGLIFLPKRDFSSVENRYLEQMPIFSFDKAMNGSYMEDFETFANDHISFRDTWVKLHATAELLCGKKENGGVYFSQDNTLLNRIDEPEIDRIQKNMGYINTFSQNCSVPVYFGLIPTSTHVWSYKLPDNAPTTNEHQWIQQCYEECDASTIDIADTLAGKSNEDIFYRTDHHWTTLGAYYGCNAILQALGKKTLSHKDYTPTTVSKNFYGTTWSSSGAWWINPDTIETWIPDENLHITSWFDTKPEQGKLYHDIYLSKKDQYSYFLGGNQPLCVIETNVSGDKLLAIRDSYADTLAPFLTERFSEIHLLDLRYNKLNVLDYVNENEIDTVLILYGFSSFISDRNLVFLSK
ncbi:MAG: hypothetical protein E7267_01620 [Lachnospiraceae bacterium]|nr:hypothetical protein [Lachnospiraceae bacterium]